MKTRFPTPFKNISKAGAALTIVLLAGIFLETWNISKSGIEEWDEARRGINAIGMISHHDYLTYYYLDGIDSFNNKPPLAIWLITINFSLFGYNEFALRLHSVIAVIIFFIYAIKLIRLYKDPWFTVIALSILITAKGVIGFHVGRTGDTDSLLLLFVTASIYHFLRYWDFGDIKSIYLSLFFAGLAFYSKGLALLLILPGIVGIIAYTWQRKKIFNRHVAFSLLIFLIILSSWYIMAVFTHGKNTANPTGAENLWQGLWQVDGVTRFFSREFEGGYDPWYLFHIFDINFNIWNYLLYAAIIYWTALWIRKRKDRKLTGDRLLTISSFIAGGLALMLVLSFNKHSWYFAPGYLFLSIITASFIEVPIRKKEWIRFVFFALVCILFIRRVAELNKNESRVKDFFRSNSEMILSADELWVTGEVRQHYVLRFIMLNPDKVRKISEYDLTGPVKNVVLLTGKDIPGRKTGQIDGYNLIKLE